MPVRGYRGVAGTPVQPWINYPSNAGSDLWLQLTFLDRFNTPVIPALVQYRIDCLTTDNVVLSTTTYTGTLASVITINIPGSLNTIGSGMADIGQNSQNNQVKVTATFSDGSIQTAVFLYEVIAIQTVGGA